jgi:tetratricopeptide (TPR) repeat protein
VAGAVRQSSPGDAPRELRQRFAIEEELGRGGMGRVVIARDLRIGRRVAIKFLVDAGHDPHALGRFEQEARAAGGLNHPNIVSVFDVGSSTDGPYIVSELLEGETLRQRLGRGPLAPAEAVDRATQLAHGLAAAHEHGIVHRDLKPENLFITSDGRVKILDFGVAKLLPVEDTGAHGSEKPVSTDTGAIIGTVGYMSPEQVRGGRVDYRTDIFSFGTVLHEMLSGTSPFQRASPVETGAAILNDLPPALPVCIPSHLAAIVTRCLAKAPERRFQSCDQLLSALSVIDPRRGDVLSTMFRRRRLAAAILLALIATAMAIGVWWRRRTRSAPELSEAVAVLPFTVRGAAQVSYLADGMVELLSMNLPRGALRAVDPHALLTFVGRADPPPDPRRARSVASHFGAKLYVLGGIIGSGTHLRIHASLYDSGAGEAPVREAKVEGGSDRIFELVDELTQQLYAGAAAARPLLNRVPADRQVRIAERTTSSAVALKAYLEGEQERRRIRIAAAKAAFNRAVEADPSFALAHYKLAVSSQYGEQDADTFDGPLAASSIKRAVELSRNLPEQEQKHIAAFYAFLNGKPREAERLTREILRLHPDDVESWVLLGATLFYWGHLWGVAPTAANEATEKVLVLDPRNEMALTWRAAASLVSGDWDEATALTDRILHLDPPIAEQMLARWRATRALLAHDRDRLREIVAQLRSAKAGTILSISLGMISVPGGLEAAEDFARILLDPARPAADHAEGHNLLGGLEERRGRLASARKHREAVLAFNHSPDYRIKASTVLVKASLYSAPRAAELASEREALSRVNGDMPKSLADLKLAWLGRISGLLGDFEDAERIAAGLEREAPWSDGSSLPRDLAFWVRATAESKAGRPQAALAAIDQMRVEAPLDSGGFWLYPRVNFLRAELLLALGRGEEAARWFRAHYHADEFVAPRFRRLAQIEEKRGNREKAVAHYSRFVELWKDCDPELRSQVADAQARLAALRTTPAAQ